MTTLSIEDNTSSARSDLDKELIKEEKIRLFFEKKALEAAIFLRNNPVPEELLKGKSDQGK